jgi:hypothetical protein
MNKMSLMCSVLISVSVVHYWWKTNSEQQTQISRLCGMEVYLRQ